MPGDNNKPKKVTENEKQSIKGGGGKLLAGTLTAAIWMAACTTPVDQALVPDTQTKEVAFVNGKISFATGNDFTNFVNKEFKKPYEAYRQRLAAIVPTNAQARMNAGAEDDDVVDDPYFAGLLNAEREVMIEGINYRITNVGTFSFKEEKRAKILKAIQKIQANKGKLPGSASGRQAYQTDVPVEFISIEGGDGGWYPVDNEVTVPPDDLDPINIGPVVPTNGCGATTNSRTWGYNAHGNFGGFLFDNILKGWNALRRGKDLKAVVWSENWGVYSSAGIKSVNQHKGWTGIWRRDDADYISWEITLGELEFKDAFGNPITANLIDDQFAQGHSMVHRVFDWNTAKIKFAGPIPYPTSISKTYTIKKLRSCHFVRDEGNLTAQVKLEID